MFCSRTGVGGKKEERGRGRSSRSPLNLVCVWVVEAGLSAVVDFLYRLDVRVRFVGCGDCLGI